VTKEIPLFGAVVGQLSQRTRKNTHPLAGAIVTHFSQGTRKMGASDDCHAQATHPYRRHGWWGRDSSLRSE
jgi:hypothetical protein